MAKVVPLFVYGTLNEIKLKFAGIKVQGIERAIVDNANLVFKSKFISVPSFEKAKGKKLYGFIYKVRIKDIGRIGKILRESFLYRPVKVSVRTQSGKKYKAIAFKIQEIDNGQYGSLKFRYETPSKSLFDEILKNLNEMGWEAKSNEYLISAAHETLNRYYKGDINSYEYKEEKERE